MNTRLPTRWLHILACTAVLAGCSVDDAPLPGAKAVSDPRWIAVARGRIDIEGGLLRLSMPREGIVGTIAVHEGDTVRKGQLLATLNDEPARLAVATAEAEQKQSDLQIASLQARLANAERRGQRLLDAAQAGAGDQQSADDARENAEQLRGELNAARAASTLAKHRLAGARYDLEQHSLHAPVDADVIRRSIQVGASVSSQSGAAFILLPAQDRIVRAELNDTFVNAVHVGMHAEVVQDDGNDARFPARVVRIGSVVGASSLEEDPLLRANARTLECILAFDGAEQPALRIGQRVLVRFPAETAATSR